MNETIMALEEALRVLIVARMNCTHNNVAWTKLTHATCAIEAQLAAMVTE